MDTPRDDRCEYEWSRLTHREREICQALARGLTNRQIAIHLGISVKTVENHVHRVLSKLKMARRGEVIAEYWRNEPHGA